MSRSPSSGGASQLLMAGHKQVAPSRAVKIPIYTILLLTLFTSMAAARADVFQGICPGTPWCGALVSQ